jgi:hypothetical protein
MIMTANGDTGATRVDPAQTAGADDVRHEGATRPPERAREGSDSRGWTESAEVGRRQDRVRWGAVWAGALVALTTYLVLQMLFFALGVLDLGFEGQEAGTVAAIVSGVLGLIAFFLGGMAAGGTSIWRGAGEGIVHGALVWALTVTGLLAVALLGGGALLGAVANLVGDTTALQQQQIDVGQAVQTARESAGWGALSLGLTALAATVGGLVGSRMWPDRTAGTVDHRRR